MRSAKPVFEVGVAQNWAQSSNDVKPAVRNRLQRMVGLGGLEPPTSPLSELRSLVADLPVPVLWN